MSTNPKNTDDRVEVFIPRAGANEEPNLFVSVNGVNYLLPKGKTSMVPKFIAEEINRSRKAQEALDKKIDDLIAAGSQ